MTHFNTLQFEHVLQLYHFGLIEPGINESIEMYPNPDVNGLFVRSYGSLRFLVCPERAGKIVSFETKAANFGLDNWTGNGLQSVHT